MIQNIANGRMAKFYKEVCLLKQEFVQDAKMTVADYLKSVNKDLTVTAFKRFTLRAE
jgi:elongation factor Ts